MNLDHSPAPVTAAGSPVVTASVRSAGRSTPARGEYVHILVPTSLVKTERPALLWGAQSAAAHGATLTVLHVLPSVDEAGSVHWLDGLDNLHSALSRSGASSPHRGAVTPQQRLAAFEASRRAVMEFVERVVPASLRDVVDVRAEVSVGEVADEIARFAKETGVDLMILSSELPRGWLPILPGRLRRILQLTSTPVAIVRPDQDAQTVRAVV